MGLKCVVGRIMGSVGREDLKVNVGINVSDIPI